MKIREVMTKNIIKIHPDEPVEVAARMLTHYNIGALPVCSGDGRVCGIVTDRDLVTRCLAQGGPTAGACVRNVMTAKVISATPDMETSAAANLMGRQQVRRLPVMEGGKICGMVSLADLAAEQETSYDAADALSRISSNISDR